MSTQRKTRTVSELLDVSGMTPLLGQQPPTQKPVENTDGQFVRDLGRSALAGLANTGQGIVGLSSLAGADMNEGAFGAMYQGLGDFADARRENMSAPAREARENVLGAWKPNDGFFENVGATLSAAVQNPRFIPNLGAEAVGSIGPVGKIAGTLGRTANLGRAASVGAAEGAIVGGMTAGRIAEENPDNYSARLLGIPSGVAAGLLGGLGSRIGGRLDPETLAAEILQGKAARRAGSTATGLVPRTGRVANAARGAGIEAAQEGLQEAQEDAFVNVGTGKPWTDGIGQSFTIGALAGGTLGGALGALQGQQSDSAKKRDLTSNAPAQQPATDTPAVNPRRVRVKDMTDADAFRTMATYIATQRSRLDEGSTAADPETAVALIQNAFEQMGEIKSGREGLQQVFDAFGVKKENQSAAFKALVEMSASNDPKISHAGKKIISTATGIPVKRVPKFSSRTSLKSVENAIAAAQKRQQTLQFRITQTSNTNIAKRKDWIAERDALNDRLLALHSVYDGFDQVITAQEAIDAAARAERAQRGDSVDAETGQINMFPDTPPAVQNPAFTADPNTQPEAAPQDPLAQVAPDVSTNPAAPATPVEFSEITGQGQLFPQEPQQLELAPEPPQGPQGTDAELQALQQAQADPQQRAVIPAQATRRFNRANETAALALAKIDAMPDSAVLDLPNAAELSLTRLAKLTGVRPSTLREMTREGGSTVGSPMQAITDAIDQRKFQALQRQQTAIDQLVQIVGERTEPLGRVLVTAPKEIRDVIRKVGDLPTEVRDSLNEIIRENRQSGASSGRKRGPKSEGLADAASPAQNEARSLLVDQTQAGQPLQAGQIEQVVSDVMRGWPNAPDVTIVSNPQSTDLPVELREALTAIMQRLEGTDYGPGAFLHNGQVYILEGRMESREAVAQALYHEVVGHYGLRGVLGTRLNSMLDQVAEARPLDVAFFAHKYQLDVQDTNQRREATEEMVAALSEQLAGEGVLDQIMRAIRAWWANLTRQTLTDDQIIQDFIKPAQNFVARRNAQGLDIPDTSSPRFQVIDPGSAARADHTGDILAKDVDRVDYRDSLRSLSQSIANTLGFTKTLMVRLAKSVPAARQLIDLWNAAQNIANHWERRQQQLGGAYAGLSISQQQAAMRVMVHYSSTGTLPFIPDKARKLNYNPETDQLDAYRLDPDTPVDPSVFNNLSPDEQQVVRDTFETTSELLVERTRMEFEKAQETRDGLLEFGEDLGQVNSAFEKAIVSMVSVHNSRAARAYVPQYRTGKFAVVAKSPEFVQVEMEANDSGDYSQYDEMRKQAQHYVYTRVDTESEAIQLARQYREDPAFGAADFHRADKSRPELKLDYPAIAKLLRAQSKRSEAGADTTKSQAEMKQFSQAIQYAMLEVLKEMGQLDSQTASRIDKQNIAGVNPAQVLPNTLDYVKHFGFVLAAARMSGPKAKTLEAMREQINQFHGADQSKLMGQFQELLERMEEPYDNKENAVERWSRSTMSVMSFHYLLTNPSYYALQLTQTWLMTGPVMAGEFGGTRAWGQIAKSFATIKPVVKTVIGRRPEVDFKSFPKHEQEMFLTLQARNVLDVGMSHEFGGSLKEGHFGKTMQRLYNAARGVELINRAAAAHAAYTLQLNKLTKGRELASFSQEQQARFKLDAINYADHVVYTTHGDYSYSNASKMFRNPVGRVLLQFKKIGLIQAELMYEHASQGWQRPKLSTRAIELLRKADLGITDDTFSRLEGAGWLTDAEFTELRQKVMTFRSQSASRLLSESDVDFVTQLVNSELHPDAFVTLEDAIASKKSFGYLLGTAAVISGTISVPFLTTMFAAIARMVDEEDDDQLDEGAEATIKRVFGPDVGNLILRGFAGEVVGIDVSHRVGINMVEQLMGSVYDQFSLTDPEKSVSDALIGLAGPSASFAQDMFKGVGYLQQYATSNSTHDLAKGLASLAPLGVRNAINAGLMNEEGLVNDARNVMIPREEFTAGELLRKAAGFSPSKVSEFYDMRKHMQDVEQAVNQKRLLLKRAYYEAVESGDSRRINRVTTQWRQLQADQKSVGLVPNPLSELRQFVVRKRREAQRQVSGLTTTSRNRRVAERIAEIHQTPSVLESDSPL